MRSHSRKWPLRDWQPLIALDTKFLFVCAGARDWRVVSYWIDTLVLKNWGKYLRYCAASPFPLRGNTTQAQEVARRIYGTVTGEAYAKVIYQVPITNPLSFASHYLHLVFLSPTSPLPFYLPFCFRVFTVRLPLVCLCVGLLACHYGSEQYQIVWLFQYQQ